MVCERFSFNQYLQIFRINKSRNHEAKRSDFFLFFFRPVHKQRLMTYGIRMINSFIRLKKMDIKVYTADMLLTIPARIFLRFTANFQTLEIHRNSI